MDTNNETPKRRLEDVTPAATIDWTAPGAPAVPVDAYSQYVKSCQDRGVLPCSRESFEGEVVQPAATSGDAPDLQQIKALALAAGGVEFHTAHGDRAVRYDGFAGSYFTPSKELSRFIAAASPAVVLDLIARIERLTVIPEQAPSTEQEWAKVDPAVAFHLIERHAEDWADAGRMMEAWRAATARTERAAAPAPTYWNAQRKMIERAIIGLRDGWASRKDADDALQALAASPATASGDELPSIDTPEFAHLLCELFSARSGAPSNDARTALIDHIDTYTRAAVSAATKPTADLSGLKRFGMHMTGDGNFFGAMPDGPYVELADVQSLLATKPAAAPAVPKSANFNMLRAMVEAGDKCDVYMDWRQAAAIYEAALAAVPAASTIGTEQAQADSSHVLPPTRGTDSQQDAGASTTIVQDVVELFRACGFNVREEPTSLDPKGEFAIAGSLDAGGLLVESVIEHCENLRLAGAARQGGVTNNIDSGNSASTIGAAQTADQEDPLHEEGTFYTVAKARGFTDFGLTIKGDYSDPNLQALYEKYEDSKRPTTTQNSEVGDA